MVDETLVHGRVTNLLTRTLVPLGIQQLSQQVQILNSVVLASYTGTTTFFSVQPIEKSTHNTRYTKTTSTSGGNCTKQHAK
jgi:hypothetical protein